jgi:hypothetical protein
MEKMKRKYKKIKIKKNKQYHIHYTHTHTHPYVCFSLFHVGGVWKKKEPRNVSVEKIKKEIRRIVINL